jgi:hypothetical protein
MVELVANLIWFALEFLLSGGLDLFLDRRRDDPERPSGPEYELTVAGLVSLAVGLFSALVVRHRVLPALPRPGLSLILTPLALAIAMHAWGRLRMRLGWKSSYLATWYGGALVGLGYAIGRLFGISYF